MDIESMKREAREQQSIAGGDRKSEEYKKSLSAHGPESDSSKPSQEVAKKIAKAADVKSKSMFLEMGLSDQPSNNHQITIK